MNIESFMGLRPQGRFDYGHSTYYRMVIEKLGYDAVCKCIPFTEEDCASALKTDEHLNNLPLKSWEIASGFVCYGANVSHIGSQLTALYKANGIDTYSCSDGVCILKECAKWREERRR